MVRKHKFACYIASLVFVFAALMNVPAAAAKTPAITAASAEGVSGETVVVSVSMSDNPGVASVTLHVEYDDSVLELIDVVDTGLMPGKMHTAKYTEPYILTWDNDTASKDICVEGILVNLVFRVAENAKAGEYPIRLVCPTDGILNYHVQNVDFELQDGVVSVEAKSSSAPEEKHMHTMIKISRSEATCCREGNVEYWMCTSCGGNYKDEDGTSELKNVRLPLDRDNHDGGFEIRNAVMARANRDGYTGDTYCLGCDTMVESGKIIYAEVKKTDISAEQKQETVSADAEWINPFKDISASDTYYKAIQYVYENGLFKGVSATEFAPDVTMTRAMFVTVLGRMAGVDETEFHGVSFLDVTAGEWYAAYVEWAAYCGIVQGYGNGIFGINDKITVEQAAVILARYAGYTGSTVQSDASLAAFADAGSVAGWAENDMKWIVSEEIYTGVNGRLNPQAPASRAQIAEMLYNFNKIS